MKTIDELRAEKRIMTFHLSLIDTEISLWKRKIVVAEGEIKILNELAEKKLKTLQDIAESIDEIQFKKTGE
jgi:hypothetical protein